MRKIKAYIQEYASFEKFVHQGVPLNQVEYDRLVEEHFSNTIVKNEIHGFLNGYAERVLMKSLVGDQKEVERAIGAMQVLEELLLKGGKKQKKVTVVK